MYKSPIDATTSQLQMQIEGEILKAVQKVGVSVDKDELIRALQYDRQQYDKGYQDAMDSIVRCKDCKYMENREFGRYCNAWVMYNGAGDDGFCNYGEKKENPAGMADNQ